MRYLRPSILLAIVGLLAINVVVLSLPVYAQSGTVDLERNFVLKLHEAIRTVEGEEDLTGFERRLSDLADSLILGLSHAPGPVYSTVLDGSEVDETILQTEEAIQEVIVALQQSNPAIATRLLTIVDEQNARITRGMRRTHLLLQRSVIGSPIDAFRGGLIRMVERMTGLIERVETEQDIERIEPEIEELFGELSYRIEQLIAGLPHFSSDQQRSLSSLFANSDVEGAVERADAAMERLKEEHPELEERVKELGEKHAERLQGAFMGMMLVLMHQEELNEYEYDDEESNSIQMRPEDGEIEDDDWDF